MDSRTPRRRSSYFVPPAIAEDDKQENNTIPRATWLPPAKYAITLASLETRSYNLNYVQRLFVLFQDPVSCRIGALIANIIMSVILLNVLCNIISTLDQYQYAPSTCRYPVCNDDPSLCPGRMICPPGPIGVFQRIDTACVAIFTIDYVIRLLTCCTVDLRVAQLVSDTWEIDELATAAAENRVALKDPVCPKWLQFFRYITTVANLIDGIAIVPYYVSLAMPGNSAQLSFVRVLRILRILRIMRVSRTSQQTMLVLQITLQKSSEALFLLLFCVGMVVVFFGSIMFILEAGTFQVTPAFPEGAFIRENYANDAMEQSPFNSIPSSMYYIIVTITTVGYGDLVPTSVGGRALGCCCAMIGILILALPISVVGSNFTTEYVKYCEALEELREQQAALSASLDQKMITSAFSTSLDTNMLTSSMSQGMSMFTKLAMKTGDDLDDVGTSGDVEFTRLDHADASCDVDELQVSSSSRLPFSEPDAVRTAGSEVQPGEIVTSHSEPVLPPPPASLVIPDTRVYISQGSSVNARASFRPDDEALEIAKQVCSTSTTRAKQTSNSDDEVTTAQAKLEALATAYLRLEARYHAQSVWCDKLEDNSNKFLASTEALMSGSSAV